MMGVLDLTLSLIETKGGGVAIAEKPSQDFEREGLAEETIASRIWSL
jgi:hypothetical protein